MLMLRRDIDICTPIVYVPSVLEQPWTSKVVLDVVYESIVNPRSEMYHLS